MPTLAKVGRPGDAGVELLLDPELAVVELVSEGDFDTEDVVTEVVAVELVADGF